MNVQHQVVVINKYVIGLVNLIYEWAMATVRLVTAR
jgi:hypothetical protein